MHNSEYDECIICNMGGYAMSRTTVVIPDELRGQAKDLGVNISDVCRYALEGAISAAQQAKKAGPGNYKPVKLLLEHGRTEEWVQFMGKEVVDGSVLEKWVPESWFLTPKGNIVCLSQEAAGGVQEGSGFDTYEGLRDLRDHVERNSKDPYLGWVLQAFEKELGQPPTPRTLDI